MGVKENLGRARKRILESAGISNSDGVVLVGATKGVPLECITEAIDAGLTDVGENSVQEAEAKFPHLPHIRKHFIGHLQGNKAKKAVSLFDMIQSVDSYKIAGKISESAAVSGKTMPVLIEVRTDENKKFGILPGDLADFVANVSDFKGIRIMGLMTVGPYFENPEDSRAVFREMKRLFDSIKKENIPNVEMRHLSMGMSPDFTIAIEEGSNMVRIGKGIFGERADRER
jgi:hypothetical protein